MNELGYINILIRNNNIDDILKLKDLKQNCKRLIVAIPDEFVYSRLVDEEGYHPEKIRQVLLDTGYADEVVYFSDEILGYQDAWKKYRFDCIFYGSEYGFAFEEDMCFFRQNGIDLISLQKNYDYRYDGPNPLKYAIAHIKSDNKLMLWGTGQYLTYYMRSGLKEPDYLVDSDNNKEGQSIFNHIVDSPYSVIKKDSKTFSVLCMHNYQSAKAGLDCQMISDYRTMVFEPGIAILEEYGLSRKDELEYLSQTKTILSRLLKEFDRVCRKHNLTYYMIFGSLLGAVRHKGFVPWDDDVDVVMPRDDFDKFKKLAVTEFDQSEMRFFDIEDYGRSVFCDTMPRLIDMRKRVSNKSFRKILKRSQYDLKGRVALDICPIDYAYEDTFRHKIEICIMKAIYALMMGHHDNVDFEKYEGRYSKYIIGTMKILNSVGTHLPLKPLVFLYKACTKNNKPAKYVLLSGNKINSVEEKYETRLFEQGSRVPFEDFSVMIPDCYDEILTKVYGRYNELPAYKDRIPIHYYANDQISF